MIVFLSFTVSGCATRAAFMYSPSDTVAAELKNAPLPLKVAITPLSDARNHDNTNYGPLHLIPLVPYGSRHYDRPDAANRFISHASYNFRPSEDFAKAVMEEIKQNRFFEEVFLTQREREPGVDLIVTGTISDTLYSGTVISYGLSLYAPLLWLAGLPVGTAHNTVSLSLEMERASDNAVVWSCDVNGDWGKTVGLYYNWASDFEGYPLILRKGLHACMEKLAQDLQTKDVDHWTGKGTL